MAGMGGGMAGMPGGQAMGRGGLPFTQGTASQIPNGTGKPGDNVRQVGNKTFYRRASRWVDAEVKPEDDAKAKVIEQFSEEFFKVARGQSAEMNQYLGFDEGVTVNLNGQVYRIDPPKADPAK